MFRRQASTDFEERLAIPVGQLIEDRPACGVCQCFEDVTHFCTIGK